MKYRDAIVRGAVVTRDQMPKVYIIIVNWNGWRDTIECLESVFRITYANYSVIICDNASADGSLDHIAAWAEGTLPASYTNPELQSYTTPPVRKPIPYTRFNAADLDCLLGRSERLFLVQTGDNLGFAGASNIGLRLALRTGDLDYVWLLNNDTVVDPMALSELIATMQRRPDVGICGSTLLYYRSPRTIQALGGSVYNRWTARGGHIGAGLDFNASQMSDSDVENRMKYVVGASMLVSKSLLEEIGLLSEEYFLYSEEIDWATRAKGRYSLAYAPGSFVYHKEGSSIGTGRRTIFQSEMAEFYATRNRLIFTRRFHPIALPGVIAAVGASFFHRLAYGRFKNALVILSSYWEALGPRSCRRITHPIVRAGASQRSAERS